MNNKQELSWRPLGALAPTDLSPTRLALHWAVQPIAAVGFALVEAAQDYSHTNILWDHQRNGFVGRATKLGYRLAFDIEAFGLVVLDPSGEQRASFSMSEQTLADAFAWAAGELFKTGHELPAEGLVLPSYDLPQSPIQDGAKFDHPDSEALAELARWYANGAMVLADLSGSNAAASAVRCWPHHFDIAVLITLDPDEKDAEKARSIGVGLSPGDGLYPQPYVYVTPWPYPSDPPQPQLAGGAEWHTEGWFGAVLTGETLVAAADPEAALRSALDSAMDASMNMLG